MFSCQGGCGAASMDFFPEAAIRALHASIGFLILLIGPLFRKIPAGPLQNTWIDE
jgi:hypothetical protein